ncbi:MAG: stage 0 sporulation family protein [Thermodesulfobacteriota bacterium]
MVRVVGIRFKRACKIYQFDAWKLDLNKGDNVLVETDRGMGIGWVTSCPEEKLKAEVKIKLKRVIRKATKRDMERKKQNKEWEKEAFKICQEKIKKFGLKMKPVMVEYLFDSSKAIFYFTADTRIDFRRLVKDLAAALHARIEMRQVGVRDEAKLVGGLGHCGRALCCNTLLENFEPVTVKMAKEQSLSLNPAKLSGVCGRLMCCLSYEHKNCPEKKAGYKTSAPFSSKNNANK